ncbi:pentapeptide repeat-containing protein [Coleofasciculus sp. B1-GNL1-01]|uniref:pentapeptide repeat-containing protein n=1 Tax=Coleofasciculus sp. B1-GNL1-01 TaxID=3068484 RepID=UPI004063EA17
MTGAILKNANLNGATLEAVILENVNAQGADFRNTNFSEDSATTNLILFPP